LALHINIMSKLKKTENKYQRGKIYKLVSFGTDKVYVGSTCEVYLSNRLAGHRSAFKSYHNGKHKYFTSFELVKFDDVEIILLEAYPCNSRYELHARERHWIEQLDCVNKLIPNRTRIEYERDPRVKTRRKEYKKTENYRQYKYQYNKEPVRCPCGCVVTRCHLSRHRKSSKHLELMHSK
jgi:hypothetical protein